MASAAAEIATALRLAVAMRGAACAALSGGTTPAPAYRLLAAQNLPWAQITFALVDERFVAPDHPASNERMLRQTLAPALASGAGLLALFGQGGLNQRALEVDAIYKELRLDIAVMGMGEDGHTASWFPGALGDLLDLANPRTIAVVRAANASPIGERLTLTRAAIARAGRLLLLITGEEKRARLAQGEAPVQALFGPGMPPCQVLYAP